MSSNSSIAAQIQFESDSIIANYLTLVGLCLLVYDTVLTLDDEVNYVWGQSIRLGTLLYAQARYGLLLNLTLVFIIDIFNFTSIPCNVMNFLANLSLLMYLLGTQGLSLGRAYAVASGKKLIMVILIIFMVLVQFIQITETVLAFSCNQGFSGPKARAYNYLNFSSNIIVVLFETGILLVTSYKVWGLYRLEKSSKSENDRLSLGTLCLRQSIFRFATIFIFSLEQAISLNLSNFRLGGVEANIEFALSTILVCRFLLQLRQYYDHTTTTPAHTLSRFDARFRDLGDNIIDEFGGDEYYSSPSSGTSDLELDTIELGSRSNS